MVKRPERSRFLRLPQALIAFSALLVVASGCEKLVGISDTEVTASNAGSSAAGADSAGAGKPAMPGGGATAGGDAGSAGTTETGGSAGNQGSAGAHATGGSAGSGGALPTAGSSGSVNTAGSGGASVCPCAAPTPTCENGICIVRGPTMIEVTDSATPYYVDSSEVSAAQYKIFQSGKGADYSGQRAACAWNNSFAPSEVNTHPNWPVVNVDFCDAAAYCAWADKRLCGVIGGGALKGTDPTVDTAPDTTNVKKSQWYLACGGPGADQYPYGQYKQDGYCNEQNGFGDVADVKSFSNCQGHYEGLFDMVGNVEEWIDSCDGDTANTDHCAIIGGSEFSQSDSGCEVYTLEPRDSQYPGAGFRCCSK